MNYYYKILLLSAIIGVVDIIILFVLQQFQLIRNSGYTSLAFTSFLLILIAIPVQFVLLLIIGFISERNQEIILSSSVVFVVVCFLILWFISSKARANYNNEEIYKRSEKYDYSQSISVPKGYPIQLLYDSHFGLSVTSYFQNSALKTNTIYSGSWGIGDMSSHSGNFVLPDSLKLFWYSYVEDKYYDLHTKLDKDKIRTFFKEGYKVNRNGDLTTLSKSNYKELIAGITPGGTVVLWISGYNETKEVQVFEANEVPNAKIEQCNLISEEERQIVLNDTDPTGNNIAFSKLGSSNEIIPFTSWINKYEKTCKWKVEVTDFGQNKVAMHFIFFNGERSTLYNEEVTKMDYDKQSLPHELHFNFIQNHKKYKLYLEFDENEIMEYVDSLTNSNPSEPITITITISADLNGTSIQIHSKHKTFHFSKMKKVKIY